jgi:hypothetical protein
MQTLTELLNNPAQLAETVKILFVSGLVTIALVKSYQILSK